MTPLALELLRTTPADRICPYLNVATGLCASAMNANGLPRWNQMVTAVRLRAHCLSGTEQWRWCEWWPHQTTTT